MSSKLSGHLSECLCSHVITSRAHGLLSILYGRMDWCFYQSTPVHFTGSPGAFPQKNQKITMDRCSNHITRRILLPSQREQLWFDYTSDDAARKAEDVIASRLGPSTKKKYEDKAFYGGKALYRDPTSPPNGFPHANDVEWGRLSVPNDIAGLSYPTSLFIEGSEPGTRSLFLSLSLSNESHTHTYT